MINSLWDDLKGRFMCMLPGRSDVHPSRQLGTVSHAKESLAMLRKASKSSCHHCDHRLPWLVDH